MQNEAIRDEILKTDERGRVRVSAERREALLDEFERCGVSAVQFARGIGVNYTTFVGWRQRRAKARGAAGVSSATSCTEAMTVAGMPQTMPPTMPRSASESGMRWVEAVMERGGSNSLGEEPAEVMSGEGPRSLWITLPGGARVEMREGSQAKLVAELLRTLASKEQVVAC